MLGALWEPIFRIWLASRLKKYNEEAGFRVNRVLGLGLWDQWFVALGLGLRVFLGV